MTEYLIIAAATGLNTFLIFALTIQTWRKRVWKRRALDKGRGFAGAFWKGFADALPPSKTDDEYECPYGEVTPCGTHSNAEWPELVEDKDK